MAGKKSASKTKPEARPIAATSSKSKPKQKPKPKLKSPKSPKAKAEAKSKAKAKSTKPTPSKSATKRKPAPSKPAAKPSPAREVAAVGGFPFLYSQHGKLALDAFGKASGAYIAFRAAVPVERRDEVMEGCPPAIGGLWSWGPNLVTCESPGDVFDWMVAEAYGDGSGDPASLTEESAAAFAADVETWARGVHAKFPILFFLGPTWAEEPSPWGASSAAALADVMIPFLETYIRDNKTALAKDDEEDREPHDGVFDKTAMACILQYVPEDIADRAVAARAKALTGKFSL